MNINEIKSLLASGNYRKRIEGYACLADKSRRLERKYLLQGMNDKHYQVRGEVANFMGQAEDYFYVQYLLQLLKDTSSLVRFKAANSLGMYPEEKQNIEMPLINCLKDTNSTIRICAAESLGHIQSSKSLPLLQKIIETDTNITTRIVAMRAIGNIGDADYLAYIIQFMSDKNEEIRTTAVETLGYFQSQREELIQPLLEALTDKNEKIRHRAAESLGDIHAQKTTPNLKSVAETDTSIRVRFACIDSMGYMQDKKNIPWLKAKLKTEDEKLKSTIYTALIESGEKKYFTELLELLNHKNTQIRLEAIQRLVSVVANYCSKNQVIKALREKEKYEKNNKCLKAIQRGLIVLKK